jgi:hypothetical protein
MLKALIEANKRIICLAVCGILSQQFALAPVQAAGTAKAANGASGTGASGASGASAVSGASASKASGPAGASSKSKVLQGNVTQNEQIDNLERLGIKVLMQEGPPSKLIVRDVRMGSNAFYKGISEGDVVKSLVKNGEIFQFTFQRGDKTYMLPLKPLAGAATDNSPLSASASQNMLSGKADQTGVNLQAGKAKLASGSVPIVDIAPNTMLTGDVDSKKLPIVDVAPTKPPEEKLVRYDIELILDITGSMNDHDGTGNMSKFEWCHEQVRTLAQKLAPYKKTFTITTFNTSYDTQSSCDPGRVEQIYSSIKPIGGTDLVDPLMARCEACLERQRGSGQPQLIAIISDGLPNVPKDPKVVNRALVEFSQRLTKPGEITITFLQIGDTFDGRDFCLDLDENLTNEGAKYDMVNTKTFDQLKNEGIVDALLDAVRENAQYTKPGERHFNRFMNSLPHGKDSSQQDASLKEKRRERKELEQQLLGR